MLSAICLATSLTLTTVAVFHRMNVGIGGAACSSVKVVTGQTLFLWVHGVVEVRLNDRD